MEPAKPFDPSIQITPENLHSFIGTKSNFQELFHFFKNELESNSLEHVLLKYYPQLMKGVVGGAFHGVIHLGWAIYYRKSLTAIAEGFAYLTYVNLPNDFSFQKEVSWINENISYENKSEEKQKEVADELFEIFLKIQKDDRIKEIITSDFFSTSGFQDRAKHLIMNYNQLLFNDYTSTVSPFSINELIIALCKLFYYTNSNNFFLLHIITSLFAIFHILQFPFEQKTKNWVLLNFFHLSIACYVTEGMPTLLPRFSSFDIAELPLVLSSWDSLISTHLTNVPTRNEHILKVAFVLKEFEGVLPHYSALFKHSAIDCLKNNELVFNLNRKPLPIDYGTPTTRVDKEFQPKYAL